MEKRTKKYLLLDVLVLTLLFLLSSTDFIMKEKRTETHKIAVLTDMPVKGQGENFKAGVTRASTERNTDMRFLNLSSLKDREERQAALQKELENGCQGLVLHCKSPEEGERLLESVPVGVPVILYNSEATSARVRCRVGADLVREGELLAEAVLSGRKKGETVTIVERKDSGYEAEQIHESLEQTLTGAGILVGRVQLEEMTAAETLVAGMYAQGGNILVSADLSVLQALCVEAEGMEIPIYGAGFSGTVRGLLEKGLLSATVVHRSYEAGYLAMECVADILRGKGPAQDIITVESAVVTAENLYDKGIESIVFPYV